MWHKFTSKHNLIKYLNKYYCVDTYITLLYSTYMSNKYEAFIIKRHRANFFGVKRKKKNILTHLNKNSYHLPSMCENFSNLHIHGNTSKLYKI